MKPDYKNWMPKGMIYSFLFAALGCGIAAACVRLLPDGTLKTVLTIAFIALTAVFAGLTIWSVLMFRAFDYNGKRQMARQIIEGTAAYVKLPAGDKVLDVGCGSGAESGRLFRGEHRSSSVETVDHRHCEKVRRNRYET